MKCSTNHEQGECLRTSREGDPSCCNCGGNHPANFRGCPAYLQHIEKMKSRSRKFLDHTQAPVQRVPVPLSSSQHFPSLISQVEPVSGHISHSSHVSFAQSLKESNFSSNLFDKLSKAQQKFSSLPDINESVNLFVAMVDELSNCNDHKGRCSIFIKYCTSLPAVDNVS